MQLRVEEIEVLVQHLIAEDGLQQIKRKFIQQVPIQLIELHLLKIDIFMLLWLE